MPSLATPISRPATFGTHATLIGYAITRENATLHLALTWHVQQPLLPPHHIFAHLVDASGPRLAQHDGEPSSAHGRAPTGSWLPDEYLTTHHQITMPANVPTPLMLQVGLYLPSTGQRLPVTIEGEVTGDHLPLPLPSIAP